MSDGELSRRPRLADVAKAAGVSAATVSMVLRGVAGPSAVTRLRVREAADRLAYRPDKAASVLASRRSRLIGLVIDISQPFHAQLVRDFHAVVRRHDFGLLLSTVAPEQDEFRATEALIDSRCEALVVLSPAVSVQHLASWAGQLPIVVLGHPVAAAGVDVVRTDDIVGFELAVAHLRGLGHRRISYIDGGTDAASPTRSDAYRQAMHRHDAAEHIHVVTGGDSEIAGAAAAAHLMRQPLPTAVITFNDRSAVGAVDALRRSNVAVPEMISVVGYDDSPLARLGHVDLTTISQDTGDLARLAIATLMDRLNGVRVTDADVVVPPHLTVRSSTDIPAT